MNRLQITVLVTLLSIFSIDISDAQTIELQGQLNANGDVEGIHILNKTRSRFTTSDVNGLFTIEARVLDTIYISSVRDKPVEFQITLSQIESKRIEINLEEAINVLDQVVIGKILTGDLASDLKNSDAKAPINFWDVGLPGYKGKRLTQSERRLAHADSGPMFTPTSINVHKILNRISGRTKRMKERVRLERETTLMEQVKAIYGEPFFEVYELDEKHHKEFWFFCQEDNAFESRCSDMTDIDVLVFLEEKHQEYLENLSTKKD